ncbi:hypothetical protein WCE39_10805 [Luteimonas sp. MJ174]|uniref:pirin family protein n=1 Tax=Luteimonas sp. MJ174 TaxID=3129237 RepID=UPI0031BA9191
MSDDATTPSPRRASVRGRSDRDGIVALEAFSRGGVIDRDWMGWGVLRVLSRQDWAPAARRDDGRVANMERLLVLLDGALELDCGPLGGHRLEPGDLLWIGCGHGLPSRLRNASATAPLRLVECWLQPGRVNAAPATGLRAATPADADGTWTTLAADDRRAGPALPGVLPLRQHARVMSARVAAGATVELPACDGGRQWLEVLEGDVSVSDGARGAHGQQLAAGDGIGWVAAATGAPATLAATGTGPAWLLLFVLPA